MASKIRKNDEVIILTGKDKGKTGKVIKVFSDKNKVLVENVNIVKKHVKPNPNTNTQGGIVDMEKPIHVSNVSIFNSVTQKKDKVAFKFLDDSSSDKKRKVRVYKSNGETIDI